MGNLQLCQNYRTISLISHSSKVMLKVILNRLKPQAEETRTVRKSDYTPALALQKHKVGIFDEKCRVKQKIQGRTNRRVSIFNPTSQLVIVNLYIKFEVSILNSCKYIFDEKSGERKQNKYREEQIGEGPFSIPQYNLLL